jgi:Subtilase family/Calx-beta domain/Bacterial pre-peptidase C-terminal domain
VHRFSKKRTKRRHKLQSKPSRLPAAQTEQLEPRLMFAVHNDSFDVTDLTQLRSDPTYSAITGKGITIAVLDTGIDALNPDFTGKVLAFYNAVEDAIPTTISASSVSSAVDNDGHGTHVSGIAASSDPDIGVADGADLVDVKVIADSGESQLGGDPLLRGLEFVEQFASQFNIKVVNMSLGEATSSGGVNDNTIPPSDDISRAIQTLESQGITVVAAAGNSYANDPVPGESYPAVVSTISVANVWADSGAGYNFNTYSYGSVEDSWAAVESAAAPDQFAATSQRSTLANQVVAPGMNIYSDWNGSSTDNSGTDLLHNTISGTSMASPFIAGVVALMQNAAFVYGGRYITDPNEILTIIKQTATVITDATVTTDGRVPITNGQLDSTTTSPLPGTGDQYDLVNVFKAIQEVQALFTGATSNADIDNTIATAIVVPDINGTQSFNESGNIGTDGLNQVGSNDIDLYEVTLSETGSFAAALGPTSGGTSFIATLRLFDSTGTQVAIATGTSSAGYPTLSTDTSSPLAAGTYYLGVSSAGNNSYNINDGSGATGGSTTGDYSLTLTLSNPDPNGVPQGAVAVDLTEPNIVLIPSNVVVSEFDGILGSDPATDGSGDRVSIPNGDVDMFKIVAPDTGLLTANVNATSYSAFTGADSFVVAYDSNFTSIASNGQLSEFASNSEIQFNVTLGQTYYVAVTVDSNAGFNPTDPFGRLTNSTANPTDYTLDLTFNNGNTDGTFLLAKPATIGQAISGSISSSNSALGADSGFKYVDWYSFTASASGLLDLSATGTTSGFSPTIQFWTGDNSDANVTEIGSTTGSGSPLIAQVIAGEIVHVAVTGAGNGNFNWFSLGSGSGGETGSYSLSSSLLPMSNLSSLSDNSIDNGTPQTITTGQPISGNIGTDNGLIVGDTDVDLYKFTPTTTGLYDIRTDTSQEGSADTLLRLFDSSGNQIAENDNATNATTASFIRASLTAGQTYYIGVSGSGNSTYNPLTGTGTTAGSDGTYVVSVATATVPAVSVAAPAEVQEPGPGGTASAVFTISLDQSATSSVTVDYATADGTATAGQDYTTTTGSVTFQPGQTTATVSVPVLYDADATTTQTFFLNLSTTDTSVVIAGGQAQATITNLPVTQHTFNSRTPATYTDANGKTVTVRLFGTGSGDVSIIGDDASSVEITLSQTTTSSSLLITAAGEPTTALSMLQINGSLAVLSAKQVELQGDLTITGTVQNLILGGATGGHTLSILGTGKNGQITLGDVSDLTVTADEPLSSLVATDWLSTNGQDDVISAPSLKSLRTTGDFAASLTLTDESETLNTVKIGGALSGGTWNIAGPVGTITADSIAAAWIGTFTRNINNLTIRGDQSGSLNADSIGTWHILGNLNAAAVSLATVNTMHVNGTVENSRFDANGEIRSITVGALVDSDIFDDVDSTITGLPTAGDFGLEPDNGSVNPEILSLTITGLPQTTFADSGSNIAAEILGRIIVRKVDTDNAGTPFGIAASSLTALTDIEPGKKTAHWTAKQSTSLLPSSGDFQVNVL